MKLEDFIIKVKENPEWEESIRKKVPELRQKYQNLLLIEDTLRACGMDHRVQEAYDFLYSTKQDPDYSHITKYIAAEEKLYEQVVDRARSYLKDRDIKTISGEEWAHLHETYGFDPSIGEMLLGCVLAENVYKEYEHYRGIQKDIGRKGLKKKVIVAKTL